MNARKMVAVAVTDEGAIAPQAGRALLWVVFDCPPDRPPWEAYAIRLATESCLHVWHVQEDSERHPLHAVDILIAGSGGVRLQERLSDRGVDLILTQETSPLAAVLATLSTAEA